MDGPKAIYGVTRRRSILVLLAAGPATLILFVMGILAAPQDVLVSAGVLAAAIALALWILFIVSSRIEISPNALTREWFLGSSSIDLADIKELKWNRLRGQKMLVIRGSRSYFVLSSLTYGDDALCDIERLVKSSS